MRNVKEAIIQMMKQIIEWTHGKKAIILPLAVVVTVVTVYSLVMPAFTLEKEEAEQQGGIDVPGVEQVNEEQGSEEEQASEEGQTAEEEEALKTESPISEENTSEEENASIEEEQVLDEKKLITKETELTSEGKDYSVSVTVNKKSAVPEDTELAVSEIKSKKDGAKGNAADGKDPAAEDKEGRDYNELYKKAKKALESKYGSTEIGSIKFYDISLVSGDAEVEPSSDVDVKIKSDSIKTDIDDKDYHIIHFGEGEPEVLDSKTKDGEISFTTDGFSVYAVVEPYDGPEARAAVNFYNYDGSRKIATVYVKNSDVLLGDGERQDNVSYLEDIVADPGVGTLGDDQLFEGWSPDDLMKSDGTKYSDSDDYVGKDYQTDTTPMTIEDIRAYLDGLTLHEGDIVNVYAMVYKYCSVTYYGLDAGVSLGSDIVLRLMDDTSSEYTVNMAFTADANAKFMGWKAVNGTHTHIIEPEGSTADTIYANKDKITINGDVVFNVYAPRGNWLVYETNGKGGTYNAPEFYLLGEATKQAENAKPANMKRYGYTFGGWYTDSECTDGNEYEFNEILEDNRTIYAKWIENETAPYTVLIWKQKLGTDGLASDQYELFESHPSRGPIGENIPYTNVNDGDQDYVRLINQDGSTTGTQYQYTGFCVKPDIEAVPITIDGKAVLNVYYDRIQYNVRFYVYRTPGSGNNRYSYGNNSNAGQNTWGIVSYHNSNNHPDLTPAGRTKYGNLTASGNIDGYTGYYFTVSAKYGEYIANKWPTYNDIQGADNRSPVSFVMMNGTRLKPQPSSGGDGTVKGIVSYMDENILGLTNNSNGNFLIVRFNTYNTWTYHIYLEALPDEDGNYPAGAVRKTINGETRYYLESEADKVITRSSNTIPDSQNAPKLNGYNTVMRTSSIAYSDGYNSEVTNQNGVSGHTPELNYYYNRVTGHISYMDGKYVDGDGNEIQNYSGNLLHESEEIPQGMEIHDRNKGEDNYYVPNLPEGEKGYVFAGWYFDKACTKEYTFDTMPIGGIIVYAKWQQIEYRVFLHPEAGDSESNPNLYWGREDQGMNFRVAYGGKVSTPTGIWTDGLYEFIGWFTDDGQVFDGDLFELNEDTVTENYDWDLEENYTDDMDQWGKGASYNKDKEQNRWWITKKLDLTAQWREVTPGAKGIDVYYNAIGFDATNPDTTVPGKVNESTEYHDPLEYLDSAGAVATAAAVPDNGDDYQFLYWVVQKYDEESDSYVDVIEDGKRIEVYPGDEFNVYKKYSKVVVTEWKDKDGHTSPTQSDVYNIISKADYSMYLRAEYGPKETAKPTHIDWYQNYEDGKDIGDDHTAIHRDTNEGLQINEAVPIYDIPEREGYKFLGWARIDTNVSDSHPVAGQDLPDAKILDLGENNLYLTYHEEEGGYYTAVVKVKDPETGGTKDEVRRVTRVAADEIQPYHDMYAVWEKMCRVKVKKVVVSGIDADFEKSFEFKSGGALGDEDFELMDGQPTDDYTVKKNAEISVEETAYDDFDTSIAVTDYEGEPVTSDHIHIDGNKITVDKVKDDMIITYTNTRKGYDVEFVKVDENNARLAGATFTLAYKETESGSYSNVTRFVIGEKQEKLVVGYYELTEVDAPDGYVIMKDKAHFQVKADGTISLEPNEYVTVTKGSGLIDYIIRIKNVPGAELPMTGGIGTTILYIAGAILTMITSILLVIRARQKLN